MNLQLPARISAAMTGLVSLACFVLAYRGLRDLPSAGDAAQSGARGYPWFAAFMGAIFLLIAILSWRMGDPRPGGEDGE